MTRLIQYDAFLFLALRVVHDPWDFLDVGGRLEKLMFC